MPVLPLLRAPGGSYPGASSLPSTLKAPGVPSEPTARCYNRFPGVPASPCHRVAAARRGCVARALHVPSVVTTPALCSLKLR